jgi:hypothetical protein
MVLPGPAPPLLDAVLERVVHERQEAQLGTPRACLSPIVDRPQQL